MDEISESGKMSEILDFSDRVALVTGGSRGIGRAVSEKLAALGASVAVNYVHGKEAAEQVVAAITSAGGEAFAVGADVGDPDEAAGLVATVIERFGKLDILVNNAGITKDALLIRMKPGDWDEVVRTNLYGTFNCLQAAAKKMIKQRSGVIVNVSSVVGVTGNMGQANYTAAKAGIVGLTKTAARELAARNIRVNAVAPGFIGTDMTQELSDAIKEQVADRIPLGRFGSPAEVADLIAFLASDNAAYITGQAVVIDGGLAM